MSSKPTITFYERKSLVGGSLEFLFSDLRRRISDRYLCKPICAPVSGTRPMILLRIIFHARRHAEGIFHQTGDIHFANLLIPSKRSLLTILDTVFMEQTSGWRRMLLWWIWLVVPVRRASRIVTISEFSKREILRYSGIAPEKIEVIPAWVSEAFVYTPKDFAPVPRILHVGTTPNKNLGRVIESLRGISCTLVVVGRVSEKLLNLAKENSVKIENHVGIPTPQVVSLYQTADVVSFPSLYEGFGMPIVESQIVGRAVVTSNRCSMPEVAGDGACLVDPLSVDSIRAGFIKVIQDSRYREDLIQKGRANARRFGGQISAQKYQAVYDKMLQ